MQTDIKMEPIDGAQLQTPLGTPSMTPGFLSPVTLDMANNGAVFRFPPPGSDGFASHM